MIRIMSEDEVLHRCFVLCKTNGELIGLPTNLS